MQYTLFDMIGSGCLGLVVGFSIWFFAFVIQQGKEVELKIKNSPIKLNPKVIDSAHIMHLKDQGKLGLADIKSVYKAHKRLYHSKALGNEAILKRIKRGWSIEETINKPRIR